VPEELAALWRRARALCEQGLELQAAQALRAAAALAPGEGEGDEEGPGLAQALEAQAAKLEARSAARDALEEAAAAADAAREKEAVGPAAASDAPGAAGSAGDVAGLQAAAEERERPPGASAAATRAAEAADAGDLRAARTHLVEAVRLDPDFYQCHAQLAALAAARGNDGAALGSLLRAVRAEPGFLKGHLGAAEVLERRGFLSEAEGEYLVAVQKSFSCSEAWAGLGLLLYRQGRLSDAVDRLRLAMSGGPLGKHREPQTDPRVLLALGFLLGAQGYLAEPCSALMLCCQQAQSLVPTFLLSRFATTVGDRHLARSARQQALSFLPDASRAVEDASAPDAGAPDRGAAPGPADLSVLFSKEAAWCDSHLALPWWAPTLARVLGTVDDARVPPTFYLPGDMDALREAAASPAEGGGGGYWVLHRERALSWEHRRTMLPSSEVVAASEAALEARDLHDLLLDLGVGSRGYAVTDDEAIVAKDVCAPVCVQRAVSRPLLAGEGRDTAFTIHFLVAALPAPGAAGCPLSGDDFSAYVCRRSLVTMCPAPFDCSDSRTYPSDLAGAVFSSMGIGSESLASPQILGIMRPDAAAWLQDEFPELDWLAALGQVRSTCAAVVAAGSPRASSRGAPSGAFSLGLPKFLGFSFCFDEERRIPRLVAIDSRPPLQVGGERVWGGAPVEVWRWALADGEPRPESTEWDELDLQGFDEEPWLHAVGVSA